MGKKTKLGKGRLDQYYHIAKEQGYRSRACFKLIQINKKFQFLQNAKVIIDLCAAPGGWLQVVSKFSPQNSIKIGVDLVPIKSIPGCKTFVDDITTSSCYNKLKLELKSMKADVVMNDGAPNVGSNWNKDAFNQIDLTLKALKLAVTFLKRGGVFLTKVFRSNDYNSLMWVMKKFFGNVEANKPLASRFTSAEIFVVCQDFLAPEIVDDRLFDSEYVFKETEGDIFKSQVDQEVNSLDRIFEKRRKRQGYADDTPMNMFKKIGFEEFLNSENPFAIFLNHSQITFSEAEKTKYFEIVPPHENLEEYAADILILGKREIQLLLKYRQQILNKLIRKEQKELSANKIEEEKQEKIKNKDSDSELEEQILIAQKQQLKQQKKDKEKKIQQISKRAHGVAFGGDQQDQELFDFELHKKIKKLGYIDVETTDGIDHEANKVQKYRNNFELNENLEKYYEDKLQRKQVKEQKIRDQKRSKKQRKEEDGIDEEDLQCETIDDALNLKKKGRKEKQVEKEFDDFEIAKEEKYNENDVEESQNKKWFQRDLFKDLDNSQINQKISKPIFSKVAQNSKDKNKANSNKQQRNDNSDSSEWYEDSSNSEMEEEKNSKTNKKQQQNKQKKLLAKQKKQSFIEDQSNDEDEDDEQSQDFNNYEDDDDFYIDKLDAANNKKQKEIRIDPDEKIRGELSDDDAYKLKVFKTERELRKDKLKKQRQKYEDPVKKQIKDDGFEVVEQRRIEDYDIDTLAETLALAKKMLRKRNQEQIIDSTYSRYSREDHENLPKWFTEDEQKHNFKHLPVTKDEIAVEKEKLQAINARAPKKVIEAKMRNYKRLQKKLKKAKEKSSQIMEQEGISDVVKLKEVKKIYNKELKTGQQKKRLIVAKKNKIPPGKKGGRNVKYVDQKTKKDTNDLKKAQKRKRVNPKVSKTRHKRRHKGRRNKA